jgi:uncharacterized protein DUF2806
MENAMLIPIPTNVDVGKVSEAGVRLVECLERAVTGATAPWQIQRTAEAEGKAIRIHAQAEADAKVISAEADIRVTELQLRAFRRWIAESGVRQGNLEIIVGRALSEVRPDAKPEVIDPDWFRYFVQRCEIVSNEDMQSLWARILAGQANRPNTFSKRTLEAVSLLERQEAELFSALCGFCWRFDDEAEEVPLVINDEEPFYRVHGLTFESLTHLSTIGLIIYDSSQALHRTGFPPTTTARYFGNSVELNFVRDTERELETGHVALSQVGGQLAPIAGAQPVPEYYDYIVAMWRALNLVKGDWSAERL